MAVPMTAHVLNTVEQLVSDSAEVLLQEVWQPPRRRTDGVSALAGAHSAQVRPATKFVRDVQAGKEMWKALIEGEALTHTHLLTPALLLVHCDLKNHCYSHRCAFPYLLPRERPALLSATTLRDSADTQAQAALWLAAATSAWAAKGHAEPLLLWWDVTVHAVVVRGSLSFLPILRTVANQDVG
jgi:hypothetical protein